MCSRLTGRDAADGAAEEVPATAPSGGIRPARTRGALFQRAAPWVFLAVLCGFAFFWRLGAAGIFDLDEGLYAEAARAMALTRDFVTPRVNGRPFFEKPPLIYWEAAACFGVFGRSEFTARLPSALATTTLVLLLFGLGSKVASRRAGLLAATLFALSPLVLGEARQLTTDATLDLWVFVALASFYAGLHAEKRAAARWHYVFWAACGLGVLAKGSAGILPIIVAAVFLALESRFRPRDFARSVRDSAPAAAVLLFVALVVPWHIAAYHADGGAFVQEWIVRQNLARFRGGDTAHHAPFWFYVPGFLLGAFPWAFLAVPAALSSRTRAVDGVAGDVASAGGPRAGEDPRLVRYLLVWIGVVFVVFSASGSKLVSYILPMYAPAALITAVWLDSVWLTCDTGRGLVERSRRAVLGWGTAALGVAMAALLVIVFRAPVLRAIESQTHRQILITPQQVPLFTMAAHLLLAAALSVAAWVALAGIRRIGPAVLMLCVGMAAVVGVAVLEILPGVDRAFSRPLHDLARVAGVHASRVGAGLAIDLGEPSRPSVFFYFPDSLMPQRASEPSRVVDARSGQEALNRFLASSGNGVLLAGRAKVDDLAARLTSLPPGRAVHVLAVRDGWAVLALDSGPRESAQTDRRISAGHAGLPGTTSGQPESLQQTTSSARARHLAPGGYPP